MKKITSLFLAALIISLSIFSVNAFTLSQNPNSIIPNIVPATESDAPPATETDPVPEAELLSVKWYKEHGKEFSADVITSAPGIVMKGKAWMKDGKTAVLVDELNGAQSTSAKVVSESGKTTLFWPDYPFFIVKLSTPVINSNIVNNSINAETYETSDGYYVEVLNGNGYELSMYFKNGELEKFSMSGSSLGSLTFEYIITSYEVDDSEFDTPVFAINITPFFRFFILLFLA